MKKILFRKFFRIWLVLTFLLVFIWSLTECAFAARKKKDTKKIKETPLVVDQKKQELLKQAQEKLDNAQWQIELIQITVANKKERIKDTLRFVDNKVKSEKLLSEGFPATSYTLSLKGANIVIWETMQTDAKGNLAFWKGEIEGERMRGVLSRQPKDKAAVDYTFVSISKETIKEEKAAAQKIEKQSEEALEEKPKDSKIEEKKKRWLW